MAVAPFGESVESPRPREQLTMAQPVATDPAVAETPTRPPSPSLDELVYQFMNNVKLRFGDDSFEVNAINGVLHTFSSATISKKEALSSIAVALGAQYDLKQDLMNVLKHKEASWAADDFDFDELTTQPCPQFLQPAHEPQMRLPSMTSKWFSDSQPAPSINPALISSHSGSHGFDNHEDLEPDIAKVSHADWQPFIQIPSSPMPHMAANLRFPHYSAPSMTAPSHGYFHPQRNDYGLQTRYPYQYNQVQEPWDRISLSNFWPLTEPSFLHPQTNPITSNQACMAALTQQPFQYRMTSPRKSYSSDSSPSILGNPLMVPIGNPAIDMPPPSSPTKLNHRDSTNQMRGGSRTHKRPSPATTTPAEPGDTPASNVNHCIAKAIQTHSGGGNFIHGICGKAFASRGKVKKHHWGARNDDIHTTTGCWAKHNKPLVDWDDHPSCKIDRIPSRTPRKYFTPSEPEQKEYDQKAPVIPTMLPVDNADLDGAAFRKKPRLLAEHPSTQPALDYVQPYHSSQLAARGSFDNLLTAVNIASRIDAPKPLGRNDSVVSYLDAQAAAAESHAGYFSAGATAPERYRLEDMRSIYSPRLPATGDGMEAFNEGTHMSSRQVESGNEVPVSDGDTVQSHAHIFSPSGYSREYGDSSFAFAAETPKRMRYDAGDITPTGLGL